MLYLTELSFGNTSDSESRIGHEDVEVEFIPQKQELQQVSVHCDSHETATGQSLLANSKPCHRKEGDCNDVAAVIEERAQWGAALHPPRLLSVKRVQSLIEEHKRSGQHQTCPRNGRV